MLAQVARLQDEINSGGAHLDRMAQPELLEIARVRADQVRLLKRCVDRGASSRERLRGVIDDLKAQMTTLQALLERLVETQPTGYGQRGTSGRTPTPSTKIKSRASNRPSPGDLELGILRL